MPAVVGQPNNSDVARETVPDIMPRMRIGEAGPAADPSPEPNWTAVNAPLAHVCAYIPQVRRTIWHEFCVQFYA